jgi:hypothetical protein
MMMPRLLATLNVLNESPLKRWRQLHKGASLPLRERFADIAITLGYVQMQIGNLRNHGRGSTRIR